MREDWLAQVEAQEGWLRLKERLLEVAAVPEEEEEEDLRPRQAAVEVEVEVVEAGHLLLQRVEAAEAAAAAEVRLQPYCV